MPLPVAAAAELNRICATLADPDDLHIAAAEPGTYDRLAWALSIAMACDDAAQARYLEIYGRAWEPLPALVDEDAPRLARGTDRYARSLTDTTI